MPELISTAFDPDDSEPNGSSIAFLVEYDNKAAFFTGDSHAPELANAIERLCAARGVDRLRLDACKMSHHGSTHNNSAELLDLLDCKRFLISTNGTRHFHPDRQALARVLHSHREEASNSASTMTTNSRPDRGTTPTSSTISATALASPSRSAPACASRSAHRLTLRREDGRPR